jgi:hypothetical protein
MQYFEFNIPTDFNHLYIREKRNEKILMTSLMLAGLFSGGVMASEYDQPGFVTEIEDGRLWVFKEGSEELKQFQEHGEPAKQFTIIGAGPEGMTVKAANQETLDEYIKTLKRVNAEPTARWAFLFRSVQQD